MTVETTGILPATLALMLLLAAPFHYRLLWRRAEARRRAERREVRSLREHWEAVPYDRMGRDPGRLSVEEAGQLVAEPPQHLEPGDIDGVDG
jgi:hypothetical protein